ncbi:hypothetical protein DLM75_10565 [Leptospira stimsonii]|uniref:Uncharacterized protein n=1 Tax=Leptospira stimsonii TaxID=2202203 RepID=A0A396Z5P5_9LEPT|nr:hypothetical protein DLM75_10565 [Leptospira stimsonii]
MGREKPKFFGILITFLCRKDPLTFPSLHHIFKGKNGSCFEIASILLRKMNSLLNLCQNLGCGNYNIHRNNEGSQKK